MNWVSDWVWSTPLRSNKRYPSRWRKDETVARLPYAARTLAEQIRSKYPKITLVLGEEDGLGVYRSMTLMSKPASKWLGSILDVMTDKRITHHGMDDKDRLTVHFHTGNIADDKTPFLLNQIEKILKSS